MDNMYYSITLGLGEYGNLMGIIFEEISVKDDIETRKTVKEIKRVRQDINHVNIIEDDKIIMKLYYSDNVLKKLEGNETHIMSTNKFQLARYNKTRDIITCQTNGSEITVDIGKETIREIKKIGKKRRNNKNYKVNSAGIFSNNDRKINPILTKLIVELLSLSTDNDQICGGSNDNDDCRYFDFITDSKEAFKKERDIIIRYVEEFLIFLNFGKQED